MRGARIYDGGSSLAGSVRSTREAVATEPTIQSYTQQALGRERVNESTNIFMGYVTCIQLFAS